MCAGESCARTEVVEEFLHIPSGPGFPQEKENKNGGGGTYGGRRKFMHSE